MAADLVQVACLIGAGLSALAGGVLGAQEAQRAYWHMQLRRGVLEKGGLLTTSSAFAVEGALGQVLRYLERLSRGLSLGSTSRLGKGALKIPSAWFDRTCRKAGLEGVISQAAFEEGRVRLGLIGLAAGSFLGSVFSMELLALLGLMGLAFGFGLPRLAVSRQTRQRADQLERELPELLEVVALGLRSGLSFDRSFALYGQHFDTPFSLACQNAQSSWGLGLSTREAALRDLAATYDSKQFSHVVETVVRALRFGSSLERELGQAAAEARAVRRAHREEQAAKAPVKMMVPTGTLILPAMLLMVLGPILLEMMNGF